MTSDKISYGCSVTVKHSRQRKDRKKQSLIEQVCSLMSDGWTVREVSRKTSLSPSVIQSILDKFWTKLL